MSNLIYKTGIHWKVFILPILSSVITIMTYDENNPDWFYLLLTITGFLFLRALFTFYSSSLEIYEHKVIFKRGILSIHEVNVQLDKVEALYIKRSVLGRLFGYGTIIYGNGTAAIPFKNIALPTEFKNRLDNQIRQNSSYRR